MEKIPEVENAKQVMAEAVAWSVMKWLREKKTVRKVADQANAALDQMNQAVKDRWPDEVRAAYGELIHHANGNHRVRHQNESVSSPTPEVILRAKKIKDADEEAYRARQDAEDTFDTAERQLSTALAREGCRKAISSWELHERAIRKAEELIASE
jgi:hypothetical protein